MTIKEHYNLVTKLFNEGEDYADLLSYKIFLQAKEEIENEKYEVPFYFFHHLTIDVHIALRSGFKDFEKYRERIDKRKKALLEKYL
jgi:predicted nucleotide-binding protein (sugar kinase/HSP70/actin superfamily)